MGLLELLSRIVGESQLHYQEAPSKSVTFTSYSGNWVLRTLHEEMVIGLTSQGLVR